MSTVFTLEAEKDTETAGTLRLIVYYPPNVKLKIEAKPGEVRANEGKYVCQKEPPHKADELGCAYEIEPTYHFHPKAKGRYAASTQAEEACKNEEVIDRGPADTGDRF